MKNVARYDPLEHVVRLFIAKPLHVPPQFRRGMDLLDSDRAGHGSWLQHPRRRNAIQELADPVVIQNVDKFRNVQAALARPHPHGELIAKISRSGLAHAGNPQMFAQGCGHLQIEVIERNQPVDLPGPRQIAHRPQRLVAIPLVPRVGHVEYFVDTLRRPVRVFLETLRCDQQNRPPLPLALAQKIVSLLVTGDAENDHGDGSCFRTMWMPPDERVLGVDLGFCLASAAAAFSCRRLRVCSRSSAWRERYQRSSIAISFFCNASNSSM